MSASDLRPGAGSPGRRRDLSHELFETMTDGGPGTAWLGQDNREIADKCHRECHAVGSRSWYTNALWSNETGACEPEALPWLPLPPEYGGN